MATASSLAFPRRSLTSLLGPKLQYRLGYAPSDCMTARPNLVLASKLVVAGMETSNTDSIVAQPDVSVVVAVERVGRLIAVDSVTDWTDRAKACPWLPSSTGPGRLARLVRTT